MFTYSIKKISDINIIQGCNFNSDEIISVKLIGIEFFKQTFKWILEFGEVVSSLEQSDDDEEIDFNTIINKDPNENDVYYRSNNQKYQFNNKDTSSGEEESDEEGSDEDAIDEDAIEYNGEANEEANEEKATEEKDTEEEATEEKATEEEANEEEANEEDIQSTKEMVREKETKTESKLSVANKECGLTSQQSDNKDELQSLDKSPVINSEIVADLAGQSNDNDLSENSVSSEAKLLELDTPTLNEIESLISDKRIEVKKYLLNAERAKRASQSLSVKAIAANREVSIYEEKLKNLSQS
jgi:hypothetical protein